MAMRDLRGKKCFITGAASGIGRATAIAAARKGARLFLTDINAEALEHVAEEIRATRRDASTTPRPLDVSDHEAVAAMADEIHAEPRQPRRRHEHRRDRDLGHRRRAHPRAVAAASSTST